MRRALQLTAMLALVGCAGQDQGGEPFVGQSIGDYSAFTPAGGASLGVELDAGTTGPTSTGTGTGGSTQDCSPAPLPGDLQLSSPVPGEIAVFHSDAMYGRCCIDWSVIAGLDETSGEILVTYTAGGAQACDCDCNHDFGYTILDVPNGTWTVYAAGQSAEVSVQ